MIRGRRIEKDHTKPGERVCCVGMCSRRGCCAKKKKETEKKKKEFQKIEPFSNWGFKKNSN